MVYRGKPSAACGECRKRRSRCDQVLPACGQCTKAGRICPGYRNTVDLMFHDETRSIARRNKIQPSSHAEVQAVAGPSLEEQALMRVAAAAPVKLTDFVLYQPLDDLGVNFFMSTYVGDDPSVSQLYYLPKLFSQTGSSNPGLRQSITAAGLAGYAKTARRNDVKLTATRLYVSAIQSINAAISDPTTVVQDATLMSIVMAAMFEVLVIPRLSDLRNCSKHLDGAVAVALMMLKQKKQTDVTYKLITMSMQSMIINSWISHLPLPANFMELKRRLGSNPKPHLHSLHGDFLDIVTELVDFREALKERLLQRPSDIIERALAVDEIFETFADTMPPHARFQAYRILLQDVEQLAFNGYYHVYLQSFTALLWNNVRAARLRLHQVIRKQCQIILSSPAVQKHGIWKAQLADSESKIIEFAIEISATVPQLAGYLGQLEYRRLPRTLPLRVSEASAASEPFPEQPRLAKITGSGTMEYTSHFGNEPSPFRRGNTAQKTPSTMSISDGHNEESRNETSGPQSASVYHMLFQLYSLSRITMLPAQLRAWVQNRIAWIESISDPEDLARLQDLVARQPGDGFPVDNAGLSFIDVTYLIDRGIRGAHSLLMGAYTLGDEKPNKSRKKTSNVVKNI